MKKMKIEPDDKNWNLKEMFIGLAINYVSEDLQMNELTAGPLIYHQPIVDRFLWMADTNGQDSYEKIVNI